MQYCLLSVLNRVSSGLVVVCRVVILDSKVSRSEPFIEVVAIVTVHVKTCKPCHSFQIVHTGAKLLWSLDRCSSSSSSSHSSVTWVKLCATIVVKLGMLKPLAFSCMDVAMCSPTVVEGPTVAVVVSSNRLLTMWTYPIHQKTDSGQLLCSWLLVCFWCTW